MGWSTTPAHRACPEVWLMHPGGLCGRKPIFLLPAGISVCSFSAEGGPHVQLPLSVLGPCLAGTHAGLVHAATHSLVSSFMHRSCCVWKMLFPRKQPPPLPLTVCLLFCTDPRAQSGPVKTAHLGLSVAESSLSAHRSGCLRYFPSTTRGSFSGEG